jgi:hypothetical protein
MSRPLDTIEFVTCRRDATLSQVVGLIDAGEQEQVTHVLLVRDSMPFTYTRKKDHVS